MSDKLIDALKGLDIEANVNLDEDRTHITDVLIAFVRAADDLVAEYAHYLDDRDGVQRELDPYDAARARLLAAITGEKE